VGGALVETRAPGHARAAVEGLPPATLASLDAHVGTLIDAAPPNTLVVVATCHGDTADTRRLQEQAYRRARGLDGLPPWSVAAEAHLAGVREAGMRALVFCRVKQ
jgi:hypothetical protein